MKISTDAIAIGLHIVWSTEVKLQLYHFYVAIFVWELCSSIHTYIRDFDQSCENCERESFYHINIFFLLLPLNTDLSLQLEMQKKRENRQGEGAKTFILIHNFYVHLFFAILWLCTLCVCLFSLCIAP